MHNKMQELFEASSKYFIAKVNEPKNSRRASRFMIAEKLRLGAQKLINGGNPEDLPDKEIQTDILISKICRFRANGADQTPNAFLQATNEYKNSPEFKTVTSEAIGAKYNDSIKTLAKKLDKAAKMGNVRAKAQDQLAPKNM